MKRLAILLHCALACASVSAWAATNSTDGAATTPAPAGQTTPKADNTGINDRDDNAAAKTPQDQSSRSQDRELLAAVRRAIVGDKTLSTMAHNAKIIVEHGTVTLRGPVKSEEEKAQVERVTQQVRGVTKIDNRLDVKAHV